MTVAAFFDVDKTLMRGSTMYYFATGLVRRRFISPRQIGEIAWRQLRFAVSGREHLGDVAAIIEQAQELVAGRRVQEIVALGEEIYAERMADKLWPGAVALVDEHLAKGHQVWIVTSTGQEIADMISAQLKITGALGTKSESKDGIYTGRLAGKPLHGPAKADAVVELAERQGLELSRCFAYSDSSNDIPMLSRVGNPVAVNPDKQLREHATRLGWPVVDFRDRS